MLDWLKDLIQPLRREDRYFGTLRFLRDTRVWEGWIEFHPVGHRVEVLLSGTQEGKNDQQREFLIELEQQYVALAPTVMKLLSERAAHSSPVNDASFKLVAIDLPDEPQTSPWEMCFETEPPSDFFVVQMSGFTPQDVTVEC